MDAGREEAPAFRSETVMRICARSGHMWTNGQSLTPTPDGNARPIRCSGCVTAVATGQSQRFTTAQVFCFRAAVTSSAEMKAKAPSAELLGNIIWNPRPEIYLASRAVTR